MVEWIVCPRCQGEGRIVHPAVSVWTGSDIDDDPDGFEEMMQGSYDMSCILCGGRRVVTQVEIDELEQDRGAAREMAMESADWEGYSNPDSMLLYRRR